MLYNKHISLIESLREIFFTFIVDNNLLQKFCRTEKYCRVGVDI